MATTLATALRSRFTAALLALAGSWRWLAYSALAAGAAAISIVIYQEIHANPTDKGNYGYQTLGRERVLLMNDDANTTCPIDYESYAYSQKSSLTNRKKYKAFWTFVETDTISLYNLQANPYTELHVSDNGNPGDRLWAVIHCRHGNTFSTDANIRKISNYLPFAATSKAINNPNNAATETTAGQIVMRNTPDAQVVSSCYPDGIGTVYFDAVNGFVGYLKGQIAVEVAYGVFKTNLTGQVEGTRIPEDLETDADGNFIPPDDAHCDEVRHVEDTDAGSELETTPFGRVAWVRANLTGVKNANGAFTHLSTNTVVTLDIAAGNSSENFYRVWAPIADPAINSDLFERARGPMRFRLKRVDRPQDDTSLRRLSLDGENTGTSDRHKNALLLVDNVIASYPPMKAWAIPEGEYVPSGKKNVIGWTGAVSPVKYPSVGATGLKAAAGLAFATNNPAGARSGWIAETKASMTYRWRYMDQIIEDWQPIDLAMDGDRLVSTDDFALTNLVGDVEFKYDVTLDAPYYQYLDYSGSTKFTAENPTPGYLERIAKVTSALNPEARGQGNIPLALPSGGTDFFFRLRAGKSDQLELQLEVRKTGKTATQTNALWLVSDGTWKTYLKTTTNETSRTALTAGDYEFRVIGLDPQKVFGGAAVAELPWSGKPLSAKDEDTGWTSIHIDAVTGALMFQVMESEESPDFMTYSIVRADYQDFSLWSDAVVPDGLYTGAFFEGKGKQSGSSPDARQYPGELPAWNVGIDPDKSKWWTEKFIPDSGKTPEQGYGPYRAYQPFEQRVRTPNGWQAWNGQWVCAKWRESAANGNMAFQLGGDKSGGLEFTSVSSAPRGVDQLKLKARIAQMAAFDRFACYFGGALSGYKDYVFSTRAVMSTSDPATEFDGNGSISLVGYYQPGTGCYELRAERSANDKVRLYLYKWYVEKRAVKAKLVGYHNTDMAFTTGSYLRCDTYASSQGEQSSGNFGNLFIRCQTVNNQAKITVGVMNAKKTLSDSCSGQTYSCLVYTDQGTDNGPPLTYGAFGFCSLNCPAQIINPQYYSSGNTGTFPAPTGKPYGVDNDGKVITIDKTTFRCGSGTVDFPSSASPMFSTKVSGKYANWAYSDLDYDTALVATLDALKAVAPTGELELFVRNAQGAGDDEKKMDSPQLVSGFKYNDVTFTVRNHEDTLLRLSTADESDDIVVDDVTFNQWCAASYDDQNAQGKFINADFNDSAKLPQLGCPTNWVYMNGWVTVNGAAHTVDLQPARVKGSGLLEVRAPLMDGLNDDRNHPENTRGLGLGMFTFNYKDADEHCVLKVQYRACAGTSYLREYTSSTNEWVDAAVIDFGAMTPAERKNAANKPISVYVGQHGFQGVMRVIVDPGVVKAVVDDSSLGADYGRITITDFRATDEPPLDGRCWWGWNIRTTHDEMERSLDDSLDTEPGLAAGLNNDLLDKTEPLEDQPETDDERKKRFAQHVPFVQSPTFATNIVGEISFKARKLRPEDPPTEVAVLGAKDGGVSFDSQWECLKVILVTNAVFSETYSYKTKVGDDYASFRLAVIGVDGVDVNYKDKMLKPEVTKPQRVLIDDVAISEAVRGKIAFDNVGAFRSPLDRHEYVTDLFEIAQQPMCEESWSVQCEIYAAQLAEEIDLSSAEVTFHWYRGDKWGYSNWADDPAAKSAKLVRIKDRAGYAFRGSYAEAGEAVVEPIYDSGAVVQYMLEVNYRMKGEEDPVTQLLSSGEWKKPEWYRGIDYNAERGGFAAYTILDTIAYGYAWINEVNVYDGPDPDTDISLTNQFVEVAIPDGADISDWTLQFITGGLDESPDTPIYTNVVARFTADPNLWSPGLVPATKDSTYMDEDSTYVFLAVGNAASATEAMTKDHYIDGVWKIRDEDQVGYQVNRSTGQIDCGMPIGIRLVRPSGIIEHEIVVAGTNRWDFYGPPYSWVYSATNYLARMKRLEPNGSWTGPCADDAFPQNYAIGVTNGTSVATDASVWAHWTKTPGRVNECNGVKEYISSDYPKPQGSMIRLMAQLQGGYFNQSVGEFVHTVSNVVLFVPKGLPNGTNITYQITNCWYELASVTETCKDWTREHPDKVGGRGTVEVPVAVYASNDVKVVAKTQLRVDIDKKIGSDNAYREAILKWLEAGQWGPRSNRQPFKNPGEIHPTAFYGYSHGFVRYLNLTEMYWLDIDPTLEGTVFRAGMCEPPQPKKPHIGPGQESEEELDRTDIVLGVFMKIYNEAEGWAYAPYTLNGIEPGQSSMDHPASWNSVTFKITGHLQNGKDATKDPAKKWMPLRYFVFDEGSFADFKSTIQVIDPFKQFADWEPYDGCPVYFRWDIDTRKFNAVDNDVLRPDSTFSE